MPEAYGPVAIFSEIWLKWAPAVAARCEGSASPRYWCEIAPPCVIRMQCCKAAAASAGSHCRVFRPKDARVRHGVDLCHKCGRGLYKARCKSHAGKDAGLKSNHTPDRLDTNPTQVLLHEQRNSRHVNMNWQFSRLFWESSGEDLKKRRGPPMERFWTSPEERPFEQQRLRLPVRFLLPGT